MVARDLWQRKPPLSSGSGWENILVIAIPADIKLRWDIYTHSTHTPVNVAIADLIIMSVSINW